MKVAIGQRIQDGPWGGGNQFVRSLAETLRNRGDDVRFDLADADIDIIVLTDPRELSPSVSFGAGGILRYLLFRNPRALVVHRINECDERKGTRRMNSLLRRANYCADHTIFIATWLRNLSLWRRTTPDTVILNGADKNIFNRTFFRRWDGLEPLRLVTHHWGGNRMKGFDVYESIDQMLADEKWKGRIEFTYIGNLPAGFSFTNTKYLPPMQGSLLARELSSHHAYITASINEPAGMHHVEGAMCGLPLLYRRSGALPEYCEGFGISFDATDFEACLEQLIEQYDALEVKMPAYPHTAERSCENYLTLFDKLIKSRENILTSRSLWRSVWLLLRNQIPL
jgi:hypothetical protein